MNEQPVPEVLRAAGLLFQPGEVIEVRVPKAGRLKTISGYFDNWQKLAAAVDQLESAKHPGIYWTLNPCRRDIMARSSNRVQSYARETTGDREILRRLWLPVDFDPKRPVGISSTEAEHQAALVCAQHTASALLSEGWPQAIYADSGNGGHLLYRVDLPNDAESATLVKQALHALAARFSTPEVEIDLNVYNASRIFKVYGTTARKGDNTSERPHRLSRILEAPAQLTPVLLDLLRTLAAQAPAKEANRPTSQQSGRQDFGSFNLRRWLDQHGIRYRDPVPYNGGHKFVLEECPFNPQHQAPDSMVAEYSDGYAFKCLHSSCADRHWRDFRGLFEPESQRRRAGNSYAPAMSLMPEEELPEAAADEEPVSPADIEAAIDAAIAADDLIAAIRLAPEVAKVRPPVRAVIKTKLKLHFDRKFSESIAREFDRAIADAESELDGGDGPGQKPPPPGAERDGGPLGPDLLCQPFEDSGNGERIVALFGQQVRYCHEFKKWLVWDGKRWAIDELNVMRQKGKEMARLIYAQAARLDDGSSLRKAAEKHARQSESYAAISNALGMAASERGIPISALALDQHPYLLNCLNGVVDLRTGKLLPHNREFLITKLCPVAYDAKAPCPQFQRFIEWAMGSDVVLEGENVSDAAELSEKTARLVNFLQRALGYGLTADVSEKSVFVFYGYGGNNGKTTLLTLFRDLLGRDYASLLLIETVMASKGAVDSTARADMADLRGARFVQTSEVSKEDKLNSQRVKYLTQGMGYIKSRRLYENPLEFEATHKLFMDCNYRPKVREGDDAIWRRLKLVPFEVTVEKDKLDLSLPDKLRTELAGILAWAVRGTQAWFKDGLGEPPEVSDAGKDWREDDDPLKDFLEDCCDAKEGLFVPVSDLMAGYLWWAKENGEKYALGRQMFNEWLIGKGFKQGRRRPSGGGKVVRLWEGLELKSEVLLTIRGLPGAPGGFKPF